MHISKKLFYFHLFLLPVKSYAASFGFGGNDTITQVIYNICDWLSGTPAIGIGILTVIWSGYGMLHGEIDKRRRCYSFLFFVLGWPMKAGVKISNQQVF